MAAFNAQQVSININEKTVLINSNESIEHVNRGDFLVIAAHNLIAEIQSAYEDESGQQFIDLVRTWEGAANINAAPAIVIPTTDNFKKAVTALANANTLINNNMATMQDWQTQAGQVSFENLNGTQTTVNTVKQFETDIDVLIERGGNAEIIKALLIAHGLSGVYGFFVRGFEYINEGDAGIDADGKIYIYIGAGAPAKAVTAGTNPVDNPNYEQVFFNGGVGYVSTFSELKKITHLKRGQSVKTLGYYGVGDGGHGEYIIDNGLSDELGNPQIANGLTARLQAVNGEVNLLQYGAKESQTVAMLNGFTHSWQLTNPINISQNQNFEISIDISCVYGPSNSWLSIFEGDSFNLWFSKSGGQSAAIQVQLGYRSNTAIQWVENTEQKLNITRTDGQNITLSYNGQSYNFTDNSAFTINGIASLNERDFVDGYVKNFLVKLNGVTTTEIPLTSKEQGANQLATVGSVSAIMVNYTPVVWENIGTVANDSIFSIFTYSQPGHTIVFSPGKAFSVAGVVNIDNNSDKTGVTRSYRVKAYNSKIIKKDFTGSSFLNISHNPTGSSYLNRYLVDQWDFIWEGGEHDANGFNQNFRKAADIRDGKGELDLNRFTTSEQQAKALEYQALQSQVFGNPELPWYVNPLSTNTPHKGQDYSWITIVGARHVTFRDLNTYRRHEEGLEAVGCRTLTFDNCHDFNSLPTNDQFQIYIVGGGNFTNGQQHFHMRSTNGQTLVRLVVNDATGLSEGQIVRDTGSEEDDEKTIGTIDHIIGNQLFLRQVQWGDGFTTGTNLNVDGVNLQNTVIMSYNIIEAPVMNVINCSSNVGNSGIGYMNVHYCPTFSTLNVSNYVGADLCLIGIRAEHVHFLNQNNVAITNANALSDPTGTLDYWTMGGIEVGASTRLTTYSNISMTNNSITGFNFSRQNNQMGGVISIKFTEGKGRINANTLLPSETIAFQALKGDVSGIKITAEPYTNYPDHYPVGAAAVVHQGRISNFNINGCNEGVIQCERISNGEISNCKGFAISEIWTEGGEKTAIIEGVTARRVGNFAQLPGGDYSTGTDSLLKVSDCTVEDVQGMIFSSSHVTSILELRDNTFRNWGLDQTKPTDSACLLGNLSAGGAQAREVYLLGNTFRADKPDARKTLWYMNTSNETLVDKGNIYANSMPHEWGTNRGGSVVNVRDHYMSRLIDTNDGIELVDSQGKVLGASKFNTSRFAFRFQEPSVSNAPLINDSGQGFLACKAGDSFSFVARLTASPEGLTQTLMSGSTHGVYIDGSNKLYSYGGVFSVNIDSVNYDGQGNVISELMDTLEHIVTFTLLVDADVRYVGSSSSGTSEHVTFGVYNIAYTSGTNDHRFYPCDDNGPILRDTASGHDIAFSYPSDIIWYNAWID